MSASHAGGGEYFQEEIRRQLVSKFGSERVLRGGLRVYSTYEPPLQRAAEQAVRARVAEIAKTQRRAQDLQGSLVAIDPASGDVLALVGGRNFRESSFNRATQARRQAGSAFKPIIYAAALERGYAPGSVLTDLDTPIYASGESWLPVGEHEGESIHAAQGPQGFEQPCRRAAPAARRRRHRRRLCAPLRDRLGAAERPIARARHRGSDVAGAHRRLRRLRQPGTARGAAAHQSRRGCGREGHLVRADHDHPRHQPDDGLSDVEHAGRCRVERDGGRRARRRLQASCRR